MLPLGIVLTLISALVLFGGIAITFGLGDGGPDLKGIGGIVMGSLMSFVSVISLLSTWKTRKSSVSVDQTRLWVANSEGQNVILWHTLAGVGLY